MTMMNYRWHMENKNIVPIIGNVYEQNTTKFRLEVLEIFAPIHIKTKDSVFVKVENVETKFKFILPVGDLKEIK